jgi:hypothetical protein
MAFLNDNPAPPTGRKASNPKVAMLANLLCKIRREQEGCLAVALTPLALKSPAPRLAGELGAALHVLQPSPVLVLSCANMIRNENNGNGLKALAAAPHPNAALELANKLTEPTADAPIVRTSLMERVGTLEAKDFLALHFPAFMAEARTRFNFILIDTDSDVRNSASLLPALSCDAAIAVIKPGVTQTEKIRECRRTLENHGVRMLGFVTV